MKKSTLGYGYGSEFQLLRFMGRHRRELNSILSKQLGVSESIKWLDFKYPNDNRSKDRELVGFEFLSSSEKDLLGTSSFWPNKGPNWDAIGLNESTYLLVEAKANIKELVHKDKTNAKKASYNLIRKSIHNLQGKYNIPLNDKWLTDYYQVANRLAFCDYLNERGIPSRLIYILFINGYEYSYSGYKIINRSVRKKEDWLHRLNEIKNEMNIINTPLENMIETVFIDCTPK